VLTTIPTTLLSLASSGAVLLTQPVDPTTPPMLGIDPVYLYAAATLACGGLGYLVGPSIGTFFWNVVHKRDRKNVEAMDSVFWSKIERNRVDPSRQTMQNRLPDFYVSGTARAVKRAQEDVRQTLLQSSVDSLDLVCRWSRRSGQARHGRSGHEEALLRLLPPRRRRLLLSGQALCISAAPLQLRANIMRRARRLRRSRSTGSGCATRPRSGERRATACATTSHSRRRPASELNESRERVWECESCRSAGPQHRATAQRTGAMRAW
jgi:hypothetical protein